jgi:hypothetical protein
MTFEATQTIAESSEAPKKPSSLGRFAFRIWEAWPAVCGESAMQPLVRALAVATGFAFVFIVALSVSPGPEDGSKSDKPLRVMRSHVVPPPVVALRSDSNGDFPLDSDFAPDKSSLASRDSGRRDANDLPDTMRFGPVQVKSTIVEHVVKAAKIADMDPALLMAIADKESNFAPKAKARTSSASGLFQFVEATWLKAIRAFGWRHGQVQAAQAIQGDEDDLRVPPQRRAELLRLRNDPYLSAVLAAEMLKRDGDRISERIGRPLTPGETYLIHFLGPDDAERFMKKMEEQPKASAAALLPKPAKANKPIFYERQGRRMTARSVREVHEAFEAMIDKRASRYQDVESRLPASVSAYSE